MQATNLIIVIVKPVSDRGVLGHENLLCPLLTGNHIRWVGIARRVAPLHLAEEGEMVSFSRIIEPSIRREHRAVHSRR